MNFDFVTFLILEWKIRCCMVYKFLTVHSRSIYTREWKSEWSKHKTCEVGGVVGFASKASKKKRETVDIFRKKWAYYTPPPVIALLLINSSTPYPINWVIWTNKIWAINFLFNWLQVCRQWHVRAIRCWEFHLRWWRNGEKAKIKGSFWFL